MHAPVARDQGVAGAAPAAVPSKWVRAAERRQAIVDAALVEFAAKGFAAACLTTSRQAPASARAIDLYFKDKEALFQELSGTGDVAPIVGGLLGAPSSTAAARARMIFAIETFIREPIKTCAPHHPFDDCEGARLPSLAELDHREAISRGIAGMQMLIGARTSARRDRSSSSSSIRSSLAGAGRGDPARWGPVSSPTLDVKAMLEAYVDPDFGPEAT